jgi:hypothetical protein
MEYRYIVVQNMYESGSITRIGYGIAVVTEYDGVITVLNSVSDLSVDVQLIEELVERCNSQELDPIHLQDVVADFFATV